ncbi:MAG TPA: GGDEF domain-containing protein [Steroidobacteraceae bacterium]|nr:GGDEF domain-containing protein [Steroidobacteraceae bacterium]
MHEPRHAGRHPSNTPTSGRRWPGVLLAAAWLPLSASAGCLPDADPEVQRLQDLIQQNATQALKQAQKLLEALKHEPKPSTSSGAKSAASHAAALYAVKAEASGILELDSDARASAEKGLALAPNERDPVHIGLLLAYTNAVYDSSGIAASIRSIEAARALQPPGSPADTCLLIGRGLLEHRQDREDLAIVTLTQAYHASAGGATAEAHIMSADYLSLVMRSMGDYSQALALNQEKIDWDAAHDATMSLSVSRFMRGQIHMAMGRYNAAIDDFAMARELSVSLGDSQGVAFADQRTCEAHIELGLLTPAMRECARALRIFGTASSADAVKESLVLQARIDLGLGHPERALKTLNQVLDRGGADVPPRHVGPMYEWRARANAALHNYRDAYDDLQEYVNRYAAANEAERTKQAGALRARFETDREIERNSYLKRELEDSQEQSSRQAQRLRWNAVVVVAGVWVIALLIYFLIANRSYRQRLVTLASQDALTGLPNRRRTLELATAALETARTVQKPLTIAIIDMDHFKSINDRYGHASGDHVLQEFARASREALRQTDILGRWGGEEFLLVMPDTPIELALSSLERLRTLMFGIRLPVSGNGLKISLSAGLASYDETVKSLEDLIARADSALYAAKNEGRDLVRVADFDYLTSSSGVRRALRLPL